MLKHQRKDHGLDLSDKQLERDHSSNTVMEDSPTPATHPYQSWYPTLMVAASTSQDSLHHKSSLSPDAHSNDAWSTCGSSLQDDLAVTDSPQGWQLQDDPQAWAEEGVMQVNTTSTAENNDPVCRFDMYY